MARKTEKNATSRRGFFRIGLLGAGAAGALAVAERVTGAEAAPATTGKTAGYRETEHVKKVYALARF
jgi:hypothetical protein